MATKVCPRKKRSMRVLFVLGAVCFAAALAVAPEGDDKKNMQIEAQENKAQADKVTDVEGYDDSFENDKDFQSMDAHQLRTAAKKQQMAFAMCTLSTKRLRQQCNAAGNEKWKQEEAVKQAKASAKPPSDTQLGEGMSDEVCHAFHALSRTVMRLADCALPGVHEAGAASSV